MVSLTNKCVVFCDGACSGNPGKGGWGASLFFSDGLLVDIGGKADYTTNNRMELTAALASLRWILKFRQPLPVQTQIHSDSQYLIKGMTSWVHQWIQSQWNLPRLNQDLWKALVEKNSYLQTSWHFVKGHSGHPGNERADSIASAFCQRQSVLLFSQDWKKKSLWNPF